MNSNRALNITTHPFRYVLTGLLLFLTVWLIDGLAPPAEAEAHLQNQPLLGFHIARGDAEHMQAARAAGGRFVVVVFDWASIQPTPDRTYWEVPDAALRAAGFYGLEVVARLDRPPEWAVDGTDPTPWNLSAYEAFVRRVAERYGDRLAGVIIWNEPNLSLEWQEQPPDPDDYTHMLQTAYQAVKSAAPDLPVLLAGLAFTTDDNDMARNDLDFLQSIYEAGGADYFDILAAHPYGFGRPPEDPPAPDRLNFRRLERYRNVMAANGDAGKPIWITEMGWRTSAPDPDDAWQVVTPQQQAEYVLSAIELAAERYPWLERMALWELNAAGDDYGYDLWHGADDVSLTYQTLVATCETHNPLCRTDPASHRSSTPAFRPGPTVTNLQSPISILALDVIIRLGDRGTLHPHWVHLHRGGQNFSPDWQGEFFLTGGQAAQDYELLLETMQVDQPTSRLRINGTDIVELRTRTRPDQTSTWVTQRFPVAGDLLQPGRNILELTSGLRNPARQYGSWRWENYQFRHVRLVEPQASPEPLFADWQPRPSPSGWSETNRLRPGLDNDFWLTGNRLGQIWRGVKPESTGVARLDNQAANRPDLVFTDLLPTPQGQLATTQRGLFWRAAGQTEWQQIDDAPGRYGYVVFEADGQFYAGFEATGLWSAPKPVGPWEAAALADLTVLDLRRGRSAGHLYAATDNGGYVRLGRNASWQRLPSLPGDASGEAGDPLKRFITRLYVGGAGEIVVRNLDQLWLYPMAEAGNRLTAEWQAIGPAELHDLNKLQTVLDCCDPGAIVATQNAGLWQRPARSDWQRLDDGLFETTDITELLRVDDDIYAAGLVTLLHSADNGQSWRKVEGLPSVITDLLVDPTDATRWIAATAAGLYRGPDGGQSWQAISPPWTVYDLAFGPDGRLFVAPTGGLVWTDDLAAESIWWQKAEGLEDVRLFSLDPHPREPELLLAGTWGNNLGLSEDGGQTIRPVHSGLETLSVLDALWHPTAGQLTVGTIEGLFRTDDGGQSWFKLPGPLERQTIHALLQSVDGTIWAGAADGLWLTQDYGSSWQPVEDIPTATVLRLGQLTFENKTWLWAGTERAGLWLSRNNGQSWQFGGLPKFSIYNLLVDPTRPDHLIAATNEGILEVAVP